MAASALPLAPFRRGKVRDVYIVDEERLLVVATDRVSAFDVVMRETIPHKGRVLTQLTAWWLRRLEPAVQHHMLTADIEEIVREVPALRDHERELAGRSMLCRRSTVFPIECVVRGYLSGSAWKEYRERGTLAGERLPAGLRESDRLEPPLFSPATKADEGHDENITVTEMKKAIGERYTAELARLSLDVYEAGRAIAAGRGIIIADTKFEFGVVPKASRGESEGSGSVILVDEVLTPDSSRFWPADRYAPGSAQPSYDKQPLRDYLEGKKRAGRWDGNQPPPRLPEEVIDATSSRYLDIYHRLTGGHLKLEEVK
ncbi:MAG TPA: phosphoribosylaminoimidazolesuccinocarboxamide synthase [Gemmatimonadaceae bacterium]|nr:phosphoribosylaminoimidazolesuccinocarboxamide synthase [Gemmatimonadaceae bacterium]